jgi:hypothetical protein
MQIFIHNRNGAKEQSIDLSSAVDNAMEGYIDTERGTLERIRDEMQNHRRFVGELVAKLVETGKIDAETLEYLLGGDFRVVP